MQQKQPAFQMQQQSVSQQYKVDDETVNLDTSGAMTPQRTIGADQSQLAKLGMTNKSQKWTNQIDFTKSDAKRKSSMFSDGSSSQLKKYMNKKTKIQEQLPHVNESPLKHNAA